MFDKKEEWDSRLEINVASLDRMLKCHITAASLHQKRNLTVAPLSAITKQFSGYTVAVFTFSEKSFLPATAEIHL